MQLWGQTFSEHEYIRSLGISTFISELRLVYRDELFFKVEKNNRIIFFKLWSFWFFLFAFSFSTKELNIDS